MNYNHAIVNRLFNSLFSLIKVFYFRVVLIFWHFIGVMAKPFYGPKNIWLFMERGFDAQDNAWHLFKFIREKHPEINAIYAIKRNSPDFRNNLLDYEDSVIEYGSLSYFLQLFNAKYIISTHIQSYAYFHSIFNWLQHSCFDVKGKKVFLQHGCTHNFHPNFEYPKLKVDLFIAGAYNEYELLTKLYHYPETVAVYTGLARFDNLHDNAVQNQILVMPTWRAKYAGYSRADFEDTDFFKEYSRLLTDRRLICSLEEKDCEIVFYNHMEFQKFNASFESIISKRVRIVKYGEESVQSLLKKARLLVTDYSSIYYDFFYMQKPIIFFKLNQDSFQASQYGMDYDNPNHFGAVTYSAEEVVDAIIMSMSENFSFKVRLKEYHSQIFPLYDKHNCKRIFEAIASL